MARPKEIKDPHYLGVKMERLLWHRLFCLSKQTMCGKNVSKYVREKLTEIADIEESKNKTKLNVDNGKTES